MPATRSTPLVRCVLIAAGLAMAAAPALGQSRQSITIRTGHVNILPVHQRFDPVVASVRVDGRNYQITERQGVRAGIIAALECRGQSLVRGVHHRRRRGTPGPSPDLRILRLSHGRPRGLRHTPHLGPGR